MFAFAPGDGKAEKQKKKDRAKDVRKQLTKGGDFAALAAQYSDDATKTQGGRLPTFARGQMPSAFEKAAFELKENELSPVVESEVGYHIIQVLKHEPLRALTLEESRPQIVQFLAAQQQQKAIQQYLETLHKAAKIDVPQTAGR